MFIFKLAMHMHMHCQLQEPSKARATNQLLATNQCSARCTVSNARESVISRVMIGCTEQRVLIVAHCSLLRAVNEGACSEFLPQVLLPSAARRKVTWASPDPPQPLQWPCTF